MRRDRLERRGVKQPEAAVGAGREQALAVAAEAHQRVVRARVRTGERRPEDSIQAA